MTPETPDETQIAEWERLAAEATPGPWEAEADDTVATADGRCIADPWLSSDADFIASARSAVPALVAAVRRLREQRDAAQAEAERQAGLWESIRDARVARAESRAAEAERRAEDAEAGAAFERQERLRARADLDALRERATALLDTWDEPRFGGPTRPASSCFYNDLDRRRDALRAALAASPPASGPHATLDPNRADCLRGCGLGIKIDEDGCCAHCGHDAVLFRDGVPTYPPPDEDPPRDDATIALPLPLPTPDTESDR